MKKHVLLEQFSLMNCFLGILKGKSEKSIEKNRVFVKIRKF
jgi:hypothetical protein